MAHKSLIGGTVYEKKGGADLINGTVYQKNYGKTLIDGTVYEVRFAVPITLTVTGRLSSSYGYWELDGVIRTDTGTFEITPESVLTVYCGYAPRGSYVSSSHYHRVTLNGTTVVSGSSKSEISYTPSLDGLSSITLKFTASRIGGASSETWGRCAITAIRNDPATITIRGDNNGVEKQASVSATINGTRYDADKYNDTSVDVEVAAGTVIECSAYCPSSGTIASTYISVNGTKVETAAGIAAGISYDYVVTGDATIKLRSREKYSNITITET